MVYVVPEDIVDTFYDKLYGTSETAVLAEEGDVQVQMYDEGGYPSVIVLQDGAVVENEVITEPEDAEDVMSCIYDYYIGAEEKVSSISSVETSMIEERECELADAAIEFLSVVAETNPVYAEKQFEDHLPGFIDAVMRYVYEHCSVNPYRPMILEDDDGNEFFEEYPYPIMEPDEDESILT